ncbi:phospholipid carrier-dependent glycosyltransferase [Fontibacillus sp. BL9]|uniref:phospholipid carrier-dependent glycosyltransferase n=1 Tax=Fontibacillus sp. BL9 TaxID=3389971 RepID=UPI003978AA95
MAIVALMIWILALLPAGALHADGENVLQNAGFETISTDAPDLWNRDVWLLTEGASYLGIAQDQAHSGNASAVVENIQPNHAKWVQQANVNPETHYLISGWVQVAEMGSGEVGATIFPLGVGGMFPHLSEPGEEWKQLQFYGRTGPEQHELTIAAGIGGYGHLNTGKAYFDDLEVKEVDVLPEGVSPVSLEQSAEPPQGGDSGDAAVTEDSEETVAQPVSILTIMLFSVLFSLLFAFLYQRVLRRQNATLGQSVSQRHIWFGLLLLTSFLLRIWIALTVEGFQTDMSTFMAWAQHSVDQGIGGFYNEGMFADYPPGYIYILYVIGSIRSVFSMDFGAAGTQLLFKTPSILADLITGFLIYRIANKNLGGRFAIALSILYLWNPAILVNSSAWGQVDSFYVLFLLISIMTLTERRFERSAVWLAVAALIKPQTLIFAPVWLIACFYYRDGKRIVKSLLYGISVFGLLALPFFWNQGGLVGLIDLYRTTLASYPYASVNAFNIYALFGHNWSPLDAEWLFLSFRVWGVIAILGAVAYVGYIAFRKQGQGRDLSNSYFLAMALIVIVFVLGTKMHERYLFPALILSLFCFIQVKDRRLLTLFMGFSLTQYVNTAYVLKHLNLGSSPETDGIVLICSIANVALLVYMVYLGFDIYVKKRIKPLKLWTETEQRLEDRALLAELSLPAETSGASKPLSILKRAEEWKWIGLILLLYLAVALFQLGSTKAPQTVWTPEPGESSFYVDFGEIKRLEQVNIFGGTGSGKFKLEFGNDASDWEHPFEVTEDVGEVFAWKSYPVGLEARYAKVTVMEAGFSLNEMVFYEADSKTPVPVIQIHDATLGAVLTENKASLLFDEPSTAEYKADSYNGSYFDEIYHARTAYEYLNGLSAYENTHPPLGKVLIAVGIQLFGLNPFGWRIMGTLFGAAMLPLIYAFSLHLFGRRKYAVMSALLFTAEFMHFTQTRIATIDVYAVFFILLMFYFMSRYFSLNFHRIGVGKTLFPLFWAGLFFGIGVSAKWIVVYGGAGLAVMLGISIYMRWREYAAAKRALAVETVLGHEDNSEDEGGGEGESAPLSLYRKTVARFPRNTLITLGSCLVFFVLIPAIIYALSFIPPLSASPEGFTWNSLIQAQKNMFDYHSSLVGSHPFASSWWEWPFMKRPVWYYSGEGDASGLVSSIVAMGNPLIWWSGVFLLIAALWLSLKRKDRTAYVIWIAYFAQYVPWMLVSRETFLYHYFAMVPFLILSIVYIAKILEQKRPQLSWIGKGYTVLAVLLFAMFYPVLSGVQVNSFYVEHILRWFPSWLF